MIIVNPQDLTPVLAALRNELKADMDAMTSNVQNANTALADAVEGSNQAVQQSLNDLSVVNGEISTEVQAINAHTTAKTDEVASQLATQLTSIKTVVNTKSAIKAIYRAAVMIADNTYLTIPAVVMSKATVNSNWQSGNDGSCYMELVSSTSVKIRTSGVVSGYAAVEVIEYA